MPFLLLFLVFFAQAFSREATVISGEVEWIETEGVLSVVQKSPTATIEWDEFSIPSGEVIEFSLPTEESSVVNRICGQSSTQIDGTLKSNGAICLEHLNGSLKNNGRIEAAAVELRATRGEPFAIIQNGIIQAKERVFLCAEEESIEISGVITAADIEFKQGEVIEILGKSIFLRKGSELDASGDWGGGKVLVGTEGREDKKATFLLIEEGATVRADARMDGNGGTIVFFAEKENLFLGLASAQGGCMGGDGGLIEITSPTAMRDLGRISTIAPFGKPGTCLKNKLEEL